MAASPPFPANNSASRSVAFKLSQDPSNMSITQTFYLAHTARGKLSTEAARQDHKLRLLVGHANLLDTLMIRLSEAEREQDAWFNDTVRGNEASREAPHDWRHTPSEGEEYGALEADYESDSESSDSDGEDEIYYDRYDRLTQPFRSQETVIGVMEVGEDSEEDYDDYEEEEEEEEVEDEDGMFTLTRTNSHRPPSLCSDVSDDDEEDESNPPSPPQPTIMPPPLSQKERMHASVTSYYDDHHSPPIPHDPRNPLFEDPYLMPTRAAALVGAY